MGKTNAIKEKQRNTAIHLLTIRPRQTFHRIRPRQTFDRIRPRQTFDRIRPRQTFDRIRPRQKHKKRNIHFIHAGGKMY